jgi:membrane-bound ClpP family serine protease
MPDAGVLATVLLLVGLFLLGLEFFVPSFGMILVLAVISLIVSVWSAFKAWWGVHPGFFWAYVLMLVAGVPGSLGLAVTMIRKTRLGNRMILKPVSQAETNSLSPLEALRGKRGIAGTLMTPGGIVVVDSDRFHAESVGMLIEAQTPVLVVGVRGNRLVVRPMKDSDTEEPATSDAASDALTPASQRPRHLHAPDDRGIDPLDFDDLQG